MDNTSLILYIIAALAIAFAAGNGYGFLLKRGRSAVTEGSVYSISMVAPKGCSRNSKWAKVAYTVNGRKYISKNQIQVPMTAEIGSKIAVRYDTAYPEKLYSFSAIKIAAAFLIAVFCIAAAIIQNI